MNTRQAFLKAAHSIERNPSMFYFMSTEKPSCTTPGCVLGWVGYHLGVAEDRSEERYNLVVAKVLGFDEPDHTFIDLPFYHRMDEFGAGWRHSHWKCASILRQYADKYHPGKDHIPASVRAIFEQSVTV